MSIKNVIIKILEIAILIKNKASSRINEILISSIFFLFLSVILFLIKWNYIDDLAKIIKGDVFALVQFILSIIGLIVTIIGTYVAYITYINPMIRFKSFLQRPNNWEQFITDSSVIGTYRYIKYPTFQIKINYERNENFYEDWIPKFPDKSVIKREVSLEVNGLVLDLVSFISLDGGRYFIPLPKMKYNNGKFSYYYNQKMIKLSYIIGDFYREKGDIFNFIKKYELPINIINSFD